MSNLFPVGRRLGNTAGAGLGNGWSTVGMGVGISLAGRSFSGLGGPQMESHFVLVSHRSVVSAIEHKNQRACDEDQRTYD